MSTVGLSTEREAGSWYVLWGGLVEWGRPLARGGGMTGSSECSPGKGTLLWGWGMHSPISCSATTMDTDYDVVRGGRGLMRGQRWNQSRMPVGDIPVKTHAMMEAVASSCRELPSRSMKQRLGGLCGLLWRGFGHGLGHN